MEKLIQDVFSRVEFLGGRDLHEEGGDKLCHREDVEKAKGPLQSQSCVL